MAPDPEIARRLGRSSVSVQRRRIQLGIPNPATRHRWWTPEDDKLLGTMTDLEVDRRLNRPMGSAQGRRRWLGIPARFPRERNWTTRETKLLGTMHDAQLAPRLETQPQRRDVETHCLEDSLLRQTLPQAERGRENVILARALFAPMSA